MQSDTRRPRLVELFCKIYCTASPSILSLEVRVEGDFSRTAFVKGWLHIVAYIAGSLHSRQVLISEPRRSPIFHEKRT